MKEARMVYGPVIRCGWTTTSANADFQRSSHHSAARSGTPHPLPAKLAGQRGALTNRPKLSRFVLDT
jgi:hypothetical protein